MTAARPGSFTGATDDASSGGLFGDTLISGIPDIVATDVARAETAADNAEASETAAAASATSAASSAASVGADAAAAAASAAAAATSATNAATSATSANSSKTAAATSATNASTSATNAANSASSAAASATSASTSAATATTQANSATSSANNASSSASSSATSATASANSASAAATSEANAATSETNAAASYDAFDDRYLGSKTSDPTVDNDGDPLIDGALYFDTTNNVMKVYDLGTTAWVRTIPTTTDQAHINTVSGIATDVSTVSGISANVTTVAGISSDVTAVAADATDIGTVSTNIANVNTVAGISSDVTTVAADGTDIGVVAGISTDVSTVSGIASNVTTVAGISGNVTTVAGNSANVTTVGTNIANVNTTATNIANVNTVAGISADVTTVATYASDLQTVATDIAAVITAANDLNEAVSEIDTVANSITNVNLVGTDITNVNTVASNLTNVNAFADTYFISATAPSSPTIGDLWFDTSTNTMKVYGSSGFQNAGSSVNGTANRVSYTATAGQTVFNATYDAGFIDVYLNGIKLVNGTDFTATNGTSVTLSSGATLNDVVDIVGYGTFQLVNLSINDATDVNTTGVTNGQALLYNSSSGAFEAGDVDAFPTQTGNSGYFLTTDGSNVSWASVITDLVNDTTPQLGGNLDLNSSDITGTGNISITGTETLNRATDGTLIQFNRAGTGVGSITVAAAGTTYNTTSDGRLKTEVKPIENATDKVMAMNAVTHKWKADPSINAVTGFIAQEMAEVVPEAVSKGDVWSMDYGRITPVIVAALQEANKKIEQLEQRIADMEANHG